MKSPFFSWLRIVLKWFAFLPFYFLFSIASFLICPIAPLFRDEEYRLPAWLAWCSTPNSNLLGDRKHRERWAGKSEYLQMVAWIWRNPGVVAQSNLLGFVMKEGDEHVLHGDKHDISTSHGIGGKQLSYVRRGDEIVAFQYYAIIQYPFAQQRSLRFIIGWKIWEDPEPREAPYQFSFIIQVWKTFHTEWVED